MITITDENFEEVVRTNTIILIDFWAEWCGPCKKIAPILEEISSEYGIAIGKINVDENLVKPAQHGISSIPTIVLYEDGILMKTIVGAKPKHLMLKELDQWL